MDVADAWARVLAHQPKRRILYKEILTQLFQRGYATTTDTAKALHMSVRTVRVYYKELIQRGVIEKKRYNVDGRWQWRYEWGADVKYAVQKGYRPIVKGGVL